MEKPYRYEVVTEFWNGKIIHEHVNNYKPNDKRLGVVKETCYIDTRFNAKLRLYKYLQRKIKRFECGDFCALPSNT